MVKKRRRNNKTQAVQFNLNKPQIMPKLLFFCSLFFYYASYCQSPKQVLEWINTAHLEKENFYYEIPFEYKNGLIVIKVQIGSSLYDYIFDTGGYTLITDDIQNKNNFPVLTTQTVGSSNKLKTQVNIVKLDSLHIGPLSFKKVGAIQMDINSPTVKCTADGGLIGAALISSCIWQIDYHQKKIFITDRLEQLKGLDKALKVPVSLSKTLMPYIQVKINGKNQKFLFDLGSTGYFSMTSKKALQLAGNSTIYEKSGAASESINGDVYLPVRTFKADQIEIKKLKFLNQPVLFTEAETDELIGSQIVKDFVVTLNFKAKEIYFLPIQDSIIQKGWETFGFSLGYKDGEIFIKVIDTGLSAQKAGLQLNDRVLRINGTDPSYLNACTLQEQFNSLFSGLKSVELTVERNGQKINIAIAREKIF